MKTYLSAIAHHLGESASIDEIDELAKDEGLLETFRAFGLSHYAKSDRGTSELAAAAATSTLALLGDDRASVGAIFYATNSLTAARHSRKDLWRLASALGLGEASAVGVFGLECANIHAAIQMARDAVASGRTKRALVIAADRVEPGDSRIMSPDVTVLSDGAASAIVSAETGPEPCFAIDAQALVSDPALYKVDALATVQRRSMSAIRRAVAEALDGLAIEAVAVLVTNNYTRSIMRSYASEIGIDFAKVHANGLPRFGHAFSADTLIGLNDVGSRLRSGDRCLVVAAGPTTWGATLLTKT